MSDPRSMSEKAWQATVLEAATVLGWRHYHPYDSRRSVIGWPDLVLWHPKRITPGRSSLLVRELKTDKGKLSKAQETVLAELAAQGLDTGVWRPSDWDRVIQELTL